MNYEKKLTVNEKAHAELSVTIKKEEVQKSYNELLNKYSKELQIPGFRKGKVPIKVLETKYKTAIAGDLAGNLIEDTLKEIFEELNEYERPLPYSYPEMAEKPELQTDEDFSFTVGYDVMPKVEIKKLDGFSIEVPEVNPTEEDITKELKSLQERNALVTACKDGTKAEKDHIATIDYCEIDEEGKTIEGTERQDFVFTIGTKMNFFKIDNEIIGMQKGESKEVTKTYPEDEENRELAGKTKKIKVTVKELKYKDLPPIDDDLAQDINEKYKTLEDLKTDIKKNLTVSIEDKIKKLKEEKLIEQMREANPFELPESMVKADLSSRWIMMANQFRITPEELEKLFAKTAQSKEKVFESWREDSEKNLKGRVLVETLLKERNIEVRPEEIEAEYERLSNMTGLKIDEVKKHYADPRQKEYLIDNLKEDKLFNELYEKCDIKKGKTITATEFFESDNN